MPDGDGEKTIEETAKERALERALNFKGGTINLKELIRQDGLIAESVDKAGRHGEGVIQTFIHAQTDDKDYRQILKHALWKNREEMDKAVKAIAVCRLTGAVRGLKVLLDHITAHSAGENFQLMHESYEALTHTSFSTDYSNKKKHWWNNNDKSRDRSNSPIA